MLMFGKVTLCSCDTPLLGKGRAATPTALEEYLVVMLGTQRSSTADSSRRFECQMLSGDVRDQHQRTGAGVEYTRGCGCVVRGVSRGHGGPAHPMR